jgi:uncharacterized protein YjbI with pentapeptide repeats
VPALINESFVPERIRVQPRRGEEIVIERISQTDAIEKRFLPSNFAGDRNKSQRIVFSVHTFEQKLCRVNKKGYPLLIFDQFEEFVTLFEEAQRGNNLNSALEIQNSILKVIINLLRDHTLAVKLLFVFREDYLAKLTKLFALHPDLQDQYLRLTPPTTDKLYKIIRGPFEDQKLRGHFGRELPQDLVLKLVDKITERTEGDALNLTEVQIACAELWQATDAGHLFANRGIQGLLEDYTTRAIEKLAKENLRDPAIALLGHLVTSSDTRNIMSKDELIARVSSEEHISPDLLQQALEALESKTKLVTREQRHGNYFYEIVSEFLIPWITHQKVERLAQIGHDSLSKRRRGYTPGNSQPINPESTRYYYDILKQGVDAWNRWREQSEDPGPELFGLDLSGINLASANLHGAVLSNALLARALLREADLSSADLSGAHLEEANLSYAHLVRSNLIGASLKGADLMSADLKEAKLEGATLRDARIQGANLRSADLGGADLTAADLQGADLSYAKLEGATLRDARIVGANLRRAELGGADLTAADLQGADLSYTSLVDTNLRHANITNCRVYGIAAWNLNLDGARQSDLVITQPDEPTVSVDNLEVAQYVYTLLHSGKIRDVISAFTSKAVLVLGRFTPERKAILDAIREELRRFGYIPMLFDFERLSGRDITETVSLLAHMARFIIADLTNPSSIPKDLEIIVTRIAVPVQPLIEGDESPYAMFKDYWKYNWVLPVYRYDGLASLLASLPEKVVRPAEAKVAEIEERRRAIDAELTKLRS